MHIVFTPICASSSDIDPSGVMTVKSLSLVDTVLGRDSESSLPKRQTC